MIPFPPLEPDKGPFSAVSTEVATNVLPTSVGWGPMPQLSDLSSALAAQCYGAWWYRNTTGSFGFIAATKTKIYKLNSSGGWDHVSKLSASQAVNGTFDADTDWTKDAGVTIAAGVATFTAVANGLGLRQSQAFTAGTIYKVVYTVSGFTAGGVRAVISGGTSVNGTTRTANGTYTEYLTAVTGNNTFGFEAVGSTTLNIDNVTVQALANYTGPADSDLWQAERYGTKLYLTNINDPLQVFDVDTGTVFADAPGSPPRAKYIETVGDFLFLAYLKVGADEFPQDWQHSKIDDPTNWTVTGVAGDSDRQQIADGDEIVAIMSNTGGARIIQRRCKRRLIFTPGNQYSFQMQDIDASRGAVAPLAVIPFGGEAYFYLNETGFYVGDEHRPIGAERVDDYFFKDVNLDKLGEVQGIADPSQKIVWIRYQDQNNTYKMLGWHWQLDRWCRADAAPIVLVSAVSIGSVLNDLDSLGTLDQINIPLDSRQFKGGRITFGAFTSSNKLSLFAGTPAAATVETATTELTPETGSFVSGAKLKSDAPTYTMQVGATQVADGTLSWSTANTRSSRTGLVPFRSDAKFHRFRVNIPAGTDWDHLHGVSVEFQPSGEA